MFKNIVYTLHGQKSFLCWDDNVGCCIYTVSATKTQMKSLNDVSSERHSLVHDSHYYPGPLLGIMACDRVKYVCTYIYTLYVV